MPTGDRARFLEGVALFNAGRFWHAHEAWEDVWKENPGGDALFFKGLIQAAAAFHQLTNGKERGTIIHLRRATRKLTPYVPCRHGVNTQRLLEELAVWERAMVEQWPVEQRPPVPQVEFGETKA